MLRSAHCRQRGLSLVELLVGVAVGLLVVAGAATVAATQLSDSRRLVLEAQVQQDLRATMDIMTRELRRSGSNWNDASKVIWAPGLVATTNPYDSVTCGGLACSSSVPSNQVEASWSDSPVAFRLTGTPGVLQLNTGGAWQALTDSATLNVSAFEVTLNTIASSQLACPAYCTPGGGQACWPTVQVRELVLKITGVSVSDANVVRSMVGNVRLPNDRICNNRTTSCDPAPTLPLCPT